MGPMTWEEIPEAAKTGVDGTFKCIECDLMFDGNAAEDERCPECGGPTWLIVAVE